MKSLFRLICLFLIPITSIAADKSGSLPTADEIVTRMTALDLQRQSSFAGYEGMRRYVLENARLEKRAEMLVRVQGDENGRKHFEVVSEQGWKAANTHVLRKMLDSESDTSLPELRATTKLNFTNYEFTVAGAELVVGRMAYVLEVAPKRKDKYLFQGRIWVDAEDYALVRAEGSPAKNPSFWTKSTHFVQVYQKRGTLWFPLSTRSVTEARIFGTTDVNIEYFDYAPKSRPSQDALLSVNQAYQP